MKFIEGIVSAVQGNTKEKLNDPLIGSFLVSFIICNWQHVLVFTFGNGKIEERIITFIKAMTPAGDGLAWFTSLSGIYLLPLVMALGYVIVMPWISIGIAKLVKPAAVGKHKAAVDLEIDLAVKQRKLNEEKLLNDPSKEFLSKVVDNRLKEELIVIEREYHNASQMKYDAQKAKDEAAIAKADKETAEANKQKAIKEEEIHRIKTEYEKKKIEVGIAISNSMWQANAYLSTLNFVRLLSEGLADDGIALTHKSLTEIIAAVFGYKNYDALLNDKSFHNEGLKKLKYVLLDSEYLSSRIVVVN